MVAVVASGGVFALGSLNPHTESVGIVSTEDSMGTHAAMSSHVVQHLDGQIVYAGDEDTVERAGAAALLRLAEDHGQGNLTLVAENDASAMNDYYSAVVDDNDEYVYTQRTLQDHENLTMASITMAEQHWFSASSVVIADPARNEDIAGGALNATRAGHPLLYGDDVSHYNELNDTLTKLGVDDAATSSASDNGADIYFTSGVDQALIDEFTNDSWTGADIQNLSTTNESTFLNNHTAEVDTDDTVYVVADLNHVPHVSNFLEDNEGVFVEVANENGSFVHDQINNSDNPDVVIVANENEVSENLANGYEEGTTGDVSRFGFDDESSMLVRLALDHEGDSDPLVVADDASISEVDGTTVVRVDIRNLGHGEAQNVVVELERQGAEFEFTDTQPDNPEEGDPIEWSISSMEANETVTIEYEVNDVDEDFVYVPQVAEYENSAGTSFTGFALFGGLADFFPTDQLNAILDRVVGLISGIPGAGAVTGLSPTVIGAVALVVVVAAGAFIWTRRRGE